MPYISTQTCPISLSKPLTKFDLLYVLENSIWKICPQLPKPEISEGNVVKAESEFLMHSAQDNSKSTAKYYTTEDTCSS